MKIGFFHKKDVNHKKGPKLIKKVVFLKKDI